MTLRSIAMTSAVQIDALTPRLARPYLVSNADICLHAGATLMTDQLSIQSAWSRKQRRSPSPDQARVTADPSSCRTTRIKGER